MKKVCGPIAVVALAGILVFLGVTPIWSQVASERPPGVEEISWLKISDRAGIEFLDGPAVNPLSIGTVSVVREGSLSRNREGRLWVLADNRWITVQLSHEPQVRRLK